MFHWFSYFFCDEKNVSIKRFISESDENPYYILPKFYGGKNIYLDVRVFAVKNLSQSNTNAEIEQWNCLFVAKWSWFIPTHYVDFCHLLAFILSVHFLLSVAIITLPFWLCWRIEDRFFVYGFKGHIHHFWFSAEKGIQDHILFS